VVDACDLPGHGPPNTGLGVRPSPGR
jgi:hypothetical protein